jgi:adenosylhomocysteine nucleosidase
LTHLGIVVAMTGEALSLTRQIIAEGQSSGDPKRVRVHISGVGEQRARLAGRKLIESGAKALVSWGSAGGLTSQVSPGSLILPRKIVSADGFIFEVDSLWHERLYRRLAGHIYLHTGVLAESRTVLVSALEKKALFDSSGAIAVDMESAAVAAVAHQAGVPFVAIRVIADRAGLSVPQSVLRNVDEFGRLRPLSFLRELLVHPNDLFPLIRVARDFRAARVSLAAVAGLAGSDLLAPQTSPSGISNILANFQK